MRPPTKPPAMDTAATGRRRSRIRFIPWPASPLRWEKSFPYESTCTLLDQIDASTLIAQPLTGNAGSRRSDEAMMATRDAEPTTDLLDFFENASVPLHRLRHDGVIMRAKAHAEIRVSGFVAPCARGRHRTLNADDRQENA